MLRHVLAIAPSALAVRIELARCACRLGDEDLARRVLCQVIGSSVSSGQLASYFRRMAEIYSQLLDHDEAFRCVEQAMRLLPNSVATRRTLGRHFLEANDDIQSAIQLFQEQDRQSTQVRGDDADRNEIATKLQASSPTAYDLVPYESHPYQQTHPDQMAAIAVLLGHDPPPVERCRVLELGCASGGNLLPMADELPGSTFLGIDASSRQVDSGCALLQQAGLPNVELRCQDIMEFSCDQPFDYIICHGVYSWVPAEVQRQILSICRQCLASNGVAYISYNTFPGWHRQRAAREIMMYSSQSLSEPWQKLEHARRMLNALRYSANGKGKPNGSLLRQLIDHVLDGPASYVLHDYLEETNDPVYFHEFVEQAKGFGLRYLGEADYDDVSLLTESLSMQAMEKLMSVSRDPIQFEQCVDYLTNRSFRRTLLCHAERDLNHKSRHRRLAQLRVASNAKPDVPNLDFSSTKAVHYTRQGIKFVFRDPTIKAALFHLAAAWPLSIPFAELAPLAIATASGNRHSKSNDSVTETFERLARKLLHLFAKSAVDLHTWQNRVAPTLSEQPRSSRLIRSQAARGTVVTNMYHKVVNLREDERQILIDCDGQNSIEILINRFCQKLLDGKIAKEQMGQRIDDYESANRLAKEQVPSILKSFCKRALFES